MTNTTSARSTSIEKELFSQRSTCDTLNVDLLNNSSSSLTIQKYITRVKKFAASAYNLGKNFAKSAYVKSKEIINNIWNAIKKIF